MEIEAVKACFRIFVHDDDDDDDDMHDVCCTQKTSLIISKYLNWKMVAYKPNCFFYMLSTHRYYFSFSVANF